LWTSLSRLDATCTVLIRSIWEFQVEGRTPGWRVEIRRRDGLTEGGEAIVLVRGKLVEAIADALRAAQLREWDRVEPTADLRKRG
jgi:hypothetical protein